MPLTSPFCVLPSSLPCVLLICGIRRGLSSCAPSATLDENGACTCTSRGHLRFLLFALLDDLVFAMIGAGGGNAVGGADSSGVGGTGIGSNHSSSSGHSEWTRSCVMKSPLRLVCHRVDGKWGRRCWRYETDGIVFSAAAAATLAALGGCT